MGERPATIPPYYSDAINYLLTAYVAAPLGTKLDVCRDLMGHMRSCLIYTRRQSVEIELYISGYYTKDVWHPGNTPQTYLQTLYDCTVDWERATNDFYQERYAACMVSLGSVMDVLKQIILEEKMITEKQTYIAQPLRTQTLSEDTISRQYRPLTPEDMQDGA